MKRILLIGIVFLQLMNLKAQVANYVSNGSFESLNSNSLTSLYNTVNYWQPIDTGKGCYYLASTLPAIGNAPYVGGFQYPRTGNNYIISQFINYRGYPRNRLKETLKAGRTYCATYHVVNTNNNPYAVDAFGMYFADPGIDTIHYCNVALSYLSPQIENTSGIITDTLRWIPITGTFVATGTEKYMVIGNFRTDAATNTLLINPTYSTTITSDICIDDVSLIELNLPAYAGRDTSVFAGDSVFLGREPDVGIDEACRWYQLPAVITPTTPGIDTVAGFWVNPTVTTSYVVRQEICGLVTWDTVTIYMDAVGIEKLKLLNEELKIYPVPAQDFIELEIENEKPVAEFKALSIYNTLGELVREEEFNSGTKRQRVKTENLPGGVYSLQLKSNKSGTVSKRFVISR